ncbi:MAG: hypothetical protein P1U86_01125 [Verrucomicrobiales bacterium]|nr:hypothetical protein [Verrucomicrobiales bacterium]
MIARWPGKIEAGSETDHVSAQWDVMPTLAELTGADVPAGIDGISFLPTLYGETAEQKSHEFLYWENVGKGGWQAIRQGDWKIHRLKTQKGKKAMQIELYDLSKDIAETENLAEEFPDVVARLAPLFETGRTPQAGGDPLFSPAKKKAK